MQLFIPCILIIISAGLFFTYIDPTYQTIKDKQIEKQQYDETLGRTVEIRDFRNAIQNNYNTINSTDIDRLNYMLPTHVENIRLILDVNNVANTRGMSIEDITINLEEDDEDGNGEIVVTDSNVYGTVGFKFTVNTTYDNFKDFLGDLAKSLRIIDVSSIEIEPIEEAGNFYKFDVGIQTYWLPQQ